MFRYSTLKNNKNKIKKLLGLSKKQFEELAERLYFALLRKKEERGKDPKRKRKPGGGRHEKIRLVEDKLLFILLFYRYNLTHFFLGTLFGIDASNATRLILSLNPIIEEIADPSLKNYFKSIKSKLPKISNFKDFCRLYPRANKIVFDAFEQQVNRPQKSNDDRKKYYSGKKKMFSHKTQLFVSEDRKILNVSNNYPGSTHDKTILLKEKSLDCLPKFVPILADLGYQGIKNDYPEHCLVIPFKKPSKKELSKRNKQFNKELSADRVMVEHVIGDIKKYRVLSDKYRGRASKYNQIVRSIASLHNFKLDCPI